eukprot:TRINITY_DN6401_c0_g1_i1.p1 TRINITY_DN6401_c0_g1~~TRINITY_DN6401_c0_g1_i1.p1  ORF type:complete len:327 (-),score=107.55 TRINITY_DN6401_c0_g1_i1:43-990(-)
MEPPVKKRTVICGACGKSGHTKRSPQCQIKCNNKRGSGGLNEHGAANGEFALEHFVLEEEAKVFACAICEEFAVNPVCHATKDENSVYCRGCILKWLACHKKCPTCNMQVSTSDFDEPPQSVLKEYNSLQLCCPNAEKGCAERVTVANMAAHRRVCRKQSVPCPDGCGVQVDRDMLRRHQLTEHPDADVQFTPPPSDDAEAPPAFDEDAEAQDCNEGLAVVANALASCGFPVVQRERDEGGCDCGCEGEEEARSHSPPPQQCLRCVKLEQDLVCARRELQVTSTQLKAVTAQLKEARATIDRLQRGISVKSLLNA